MRMLVIHDKSASIAKGFVSNRRVQGKHHKRSGGFKNMLPGG